MRNDVAAIVACAYTRVLHSQPKLIDNQYTGFDLIVALEFASLTVIFERNRKKCVCN